MLFFFFFILLIMMNIKFCQSTDYVFLKYIDAASGRKKVGLFADRMLTDMAEYSVLEFALGKQYRQGKLSKLELNEQMGMFVRGQGLHEPTRRKIVQFGGGNGEKGGRQFALGFAGNDHILAAFQQMEKSPGGQQIGSLKNLAKALNKRYKSVVAEKGLARQKAEYLATDGRQIFGITLGRSGPRKFLGIGIGGEKGPKIRKMGGNLHAIGWEADNLRAMLAPIYGGKRRAIRGDAELVGDVANAFAHQSAHLSHPNPVSASFDGVLMEGRGKMRRWNVKTKATGGEIIYVQNHRTDEHQGLAQLQQDHQMHYVRQQLQRSEGHQYRNVVRHEQLANWRRKNPGDRQNVWARKNAAKWGQRRDSIDLAMLDRLYRPRPVQANLQRKMFRRVGSLPNFRFAY